MDCRTSCVITTALIGIEFFLVDRDALFRGADVDGVLVFVVLHDIDSFEFQI